jgi:hypothetical protein
MATSSATDSRQTSIYADIPQFGGPTSVGGQLVVIAILIALLLPAGNFSELSKSHLTGA